jgi:hypothetical protein
MGARMRTDLRSRLLAVARGDFSPSSGVTAVTGVTDPVGYVSKPLESQRSRGLRVKNDKPEADLKNGVNDAVPDGPDIEGALLERMSIFEHDGTVPVVFRKAWARLNCERPNGVSEERWWSAIVAGGLLLETWGEKAAELGWQADDLFAPDTGLLWLLADRPRSILLSLDQTGAYVTAATGDPQRYMRRWIQ